jgi:hypothetical protein
VLSFNTVFICLLLTAKWPTTVRHNIKFEVNCLKPSILGVRILVAKLDYFVDRCRMHVKFR